LVVSYHRPGVALFVSSVVSGHSQNEFSEVKGEFLEAVWPVAAQTKFTSIVKVTPHTRSEGIRLSASSNDLSVTENC